MTRSHDITIYRAAALCDSAGVDCRDGAVAVRAGRILAAGPATAVLNNLSGPDICVVELPDALILPAMVNAHAHLDMSTLGQVPYAGDFKAWVRHVIQNRPQNDVAIVQAVRLGLSMSRDAGVGYIGDIAASATAAAARLNGDIVPGISYIEWLGRGDRLKDLADRSKAQFDAAMRAWAQNHAHDVRLGLEPHAPYSTADTIYEQTLALAEAHDLPLCTHLAELTDEMDLLGLGATDGRPNVHPLDWFAPYLRRRPWLLAHCNYVIDEHIALLAATGASVAYCPIASDYFGHRNHRYRDMLAAGVNVCLGTDSILCQPADSPHPLSILEQMRYLHRRDGTDPGMLLAMATTRGLRAMGFDPVHATLAAGSQTCLTCVHIDIHNSTSPLEQALSCDYPLRYVAG